MEREIIKWGRIGFYLDIAQIIFLAAILILMWGGR